MLSERWWTERWRSWPSRALEHALPESNERRVRAQESENHRVIVPVEPDNDAPTKTGQHECHLDARNEASRRR